MRQRLPTPWPIVAAALRAARQARAVRLPVPVVSVGNLAFGGRSKTPFVRLLCHKLAQRGHRPGIVSRGYGRSGGPISTIVTNRHHAAEVGDEALMLARGHPDWLVVVDPIRARGGRLAVEAGAEVVVLDDGFQHSQLQRDLDLLMVIPSDGQDACPPWGRLREPWSQHVLADGIVVSDGDIEGAHARIQARLTAIGGRPIGAWDGQDVAVLAGIARPCRLTRLLTEAGINIRARRWLCDHGRFGRAEVARLRRRAPGCPILITEKDAARLPNGAKSLGCDVVEVCLDWVYGEDWIDGQLAQLFVGERR